MIQMLKNMSRLCVIGYKLARADALFPFEKLKFAPMITFWAKILRKKQTGLREGQRLAQALYELGPMFIKLGQALSVRADIIGDELAEDLSHLQDRLPAFSFVHVKRIIESEFQQPIKQLYQSFEETPVAAASIAQVHKAITTDGKHVAVKVLRPGIIQAYAKDVSLFYGIVELIERAQPPLKRLKLSEVVKVIDHSIKTELNLTLEAASAEELAENFADTPYYQPPTIDWLRTSERVLTLSWIEGIPIDEVHALKAANHDVKQILTHSVTNFFYQVFRDGFFHADIHGGNAFIDKDGVIRPVDFGIMGRLDRETRFFLAQLLLGLLKGNYRLLAKIHVEMGMLPETVSEAEFALACRAVVGPFMCAQALGQEVSYAKLLSQMFRLMEAFNIEVQPQLFLLQKTMIMAEGMGKKLYPNHNMWVLVEPLIERWMRDYLGPEAKLAFGLVEMYEEVKRIPSILKKLEDRLAQDHTQIIIHSGIASKYYYRIIEVIILLGIGFSFGYMSYLWL